MDSHAPHTADHASLAIGAFAGVFALADQVASRWWVPIVCALIGALPTALTRLQTAIRTWRDERRTLAQLVKARAEIDALRTLLETEAKP